MKGPLTARYETVIENKGLRAVPRRLLDGFSLFWTAFRSEKLSESTSFLVWEIFHKLGLFAQEDYLTFNDSGYIRLDNHSMHALADNAQIEQFFKAQGLRIVNAPQSWRTLFKAGNGEIFGCLYSNDRLLYWSRDNGQTISPLNEFPRRIESIYISDRGVIFISIKGTLYRSTDNGETFKNSLDLSSEESYLRRDYGMTETPDNTLIIGEYGNLPRGRGWQNMAYIYFSRDDGLTWQRSDFFRQQGANKHIHIVWYSELLDWVIVTDGDNKKRMWVSEDWGSFDIGKPKWNLVNKRHILMGGHTAVIESEGGLLFGTDYMGGTNFILESTDCRTFRKKIIPDPYRRSPIMKLAHRKSAQGNEIWALLPYSTAGTKSLLMCSKDGGRSWHRIIEYCGTHHGVQLICSSKALSADLYLSIRDVKNNSRAVYKIIAR